MHAEDGSAVHGGLVEGTVKLSELNTRSEDFLIRLVDGEEHANPSPPPTVFTCVVINTTMATKQGHRGILYLIFFPLKA
jgi:hypothetical protein